ncbi:hypothetical protein LPJ63_002576, partial [Coemansia sp. RSA 2711]
MYKPRCLAILPLLAFAFIAVASEYRDESASDSVSADIFDSNFDDATEVSQHVRNALDPTQRALIAGLLKNLPAAPSPTVDPASDDQVEGLDRHGHHGHHKHHKCKDDEDDEDKDNLNNDDNKFKTISLPAQGRPFEYGEDVRHSLPPLI